MKRRDEIRLRLVWLTVGFALGVLVTAGRAVQLGYVPWGVR